MHCVFVLAALAEHIYILMLFYMASFPSLILNPETSESYSITRQFSRYTWRRYGFGLIQLLGYEFGLVQCYFVRRTSHNINIAN